MEEFAAIRNRQSSNKPKARELVSTAWFGRDSLKMVDKLLKIDTPAGPCGIDTKATLRQAGRWTKHFSCR
jgi:hypothetical protein